MFTDLVFPEGDPEAFITYDIFCERVIENFSWFFNISECRKKLFELADVEYKL